ncbi:MAG TPA: alpha/beta fold hydrolase [Kofleriaceae bacterium]|nr:alpha/beta fold hydrolase [Kofleriaceae bacterium]
MTDLAAISLVTGATGLIGRWLVPELTRRGHVIAIVRRADERRDEYLAWVAQHGGSTERLTLVDGDLAAPELGLTDDARAQLAAVRDVFHAGALMQFRMSEQIARTANVDGTRALVELALASPQLRRFVHISGFKVGDDVAFHDLGLDPEQPYERTAYDRLYRKLGGYEASKMEADHLVRDAARTRGLPLTRIHPGAVIGDSRTGETTQFFGFAPLVEQLYRGKMPVVPGGDRHWLPLVSVDFLAALIARVPELDETSGGSYTVLDEATPQLFELTTRIAHRLGVAAPKRRIRIGIAKLLLRSRLVPGGAEQAEGLAFLADRRYDVTPTRQLAATLGLAWPSIDTAIDRSIDFLVASRFGATTAPVGARLQRISGAPAFVVGDRVDADTVLLHGLPLDAESWTPVARSLGGTQLRVDLPGLGRSASVGATPRAWMEALLADARHPMLLVGHSLGTRYALEYAAAHPGRVRGLVLISPFFLQQPPPAILRWKPSACLASRGLRRRHLDALVGPAHAATVEGPASDLARPGAKSRFGLHLADAHAHRAELQRMLAAIEVPVLIVHGAADPILASTGAAEVVELAGTGHFPQLDVPDAVVDAIRRFVTRIDRAAAAA